MDEIVLITDKVRGHKDFFFEETGCKITLKECRGFNNYFGAFNMGNVIAKTKPDAVLFDFRLLKFGDNIIPATLGLLLPFVCKLMAIPTVSILDNIMEKMDLNNGRTARNSLLRKAHDFIGATLIRFVLASDVVTVPNVRDAAILEKKYKARNVALVPNGSHEMPWEPDYSLPEGPKRLLMYGEFDAVEKVDVLIEAVERIRQRTKENVEIIIVGTDGDDVPDRLYETEWKYRDMLRLRFTGQTTEEDVKTLVAGSSVVVFQSSTMIGSFEVLLQAGYYGKAVVLPWDMSATKEGYKGEFYIPENSKSLTNALENILTYDAYRIYLGQTNHKVVRSLHMSDITRTYLDFFKAIGYQKTTLPILDVNSVSCHPDTAV